MVKAPQHYFQQSQQELRQRMTHHRMPAVRKIGDLIPLQRQLQHIAIRLRLAQHNRHIAPPVTRLIHVRHNAATHGVRLALPVIRGDNRNMAICRIPLRRHAKETTFQVGQHRILKPLRLFEITNL